MAPLISSFIGKDQDKVVRYINESKRMGIKILPPDINASDFEFIIKEEGNQSCIRFGLGAIKGLSKVAMLITIDKRENGRYEDLCDLIMRFDKKTMNKKVLDALVLSGTLDNIAIGLKEHPITIVEPNEDGMKPVQYGFEVVSDNTGNLDRIKLLQFVYKLRNYGEVDVSSLIETYLDESFMSQIKKKYSKVSGLEDKMLLLSIEHSLLGIYATAHPLDGKAKPINWQSQFHGSCFEVVGIVRSVHKIMTRYKKPMAFISIETLEGLKEAVIFTKEFEANEKKLIPGEIRVFELKSQLKDGSYSYIVRSLRSYKEKVTVEDNVCTS